MSTNYYFKVKDIIDISSKGKNSPLKEDIVSKLQETTKDLSYIHIGKRSAGWKPIFQKTKYFSSVKNIVKFYNENKDDIIIVDEYDKELSFNDLEEELFNWNVENKEAKEHDTGEYDDYYRDCENYCFCIYDFS